MPIYVVTDVEVNGPIPGENSMLSFASVAVNDAGSRIDEFAVVIEPLQDAVTDVPTLEWFKQHPEAWRAANTNPQEPTVAMRNIFAGSGDWRMNRSLWRILWRWMGLG